MFNKTTSEVLATLKTLLIIFECSATQMALQAHLAYLLNEWVDAPGLFHSLFLNTEEALKTGLEYKG
jgi:hypothetical protein